jgi:murein DD-endopeptidase MepM/ murein hydrolase activator NlpD
VGAKVNVMFSLKTIGRKLKPFRSSISPYLLIFTLVILFSLGIQVQAQQRQSAINQNVWQYAAFPVENFQAYTSGFGYRASPVDGSTQFHSGLDLAAPMGSYVRNWWMGRVVELSDHTACGTMIKIQSGDWTHVYCHLIGFVGSTPQGRYLMDQEGGILLWLGQDVPVGARIARVGMTGRTTGPHLHWGLMYSGQYLDPALVLREMFKQQASR